MEGCSVSRRKDVECDRKDGLGDIKSKTMSQHAVIFLRHVVAEQSENWLYFKHRIIH